MNFTYPQWDVELLRLINERNGSSFKRDDLTFTIDEALSVDGATRINITPGQGVPYFSDSYIVYGKRDLSKAFLGLPLRFIAKSDTTVKQLLSSLAAKYAISLDVYIDFAEAELNKQLNFGDDPSKTVTIPVADTSYVWSGELELIVANDAYDLANVIGNATIGEIQAWDAARPTDKISLDLLTRSLPPLPVYNMQYASKGDVLHDYYIDKMIPLIWQKITGLGEMSAATFATEFKAALSGQVINDVTVLEGETVISVSVNPNSTVFQGEVHLPARDMGEGILNFTVTKTYAGNLGFPTPQYNGAWLAINSPTPSTFVSDFSMDNGAQISIFINDKPATLTHSGGQPSLPNAQPGVYKVRIYGAPQGWYWSSVYDSFTVQSPFVPARWQLEPMIGDSYYHGLFAYAGNMKAVDDDILENCSEAVDLAYLFYNCYNMSAIPEGLFRFTPKVRSLRQAFYNFAANNYGIPVTVEDNLLANMPDLEDVAWLFATATNIGNIPSRLLADKPNLKYVDNAFLNVGQNLTNGVKIPMDVLDGSPNLVSMEGFMQGTRTDVITSEFFAPLKDLTNIARVMDTTAISSLPADLFAHNTKLVRVSGCFAQCSNLLSVPETLFDNCPDIQIADAMFQYSYVTEVPAGFLTKCKKITTMSNMFQAARGIGSVPDGWFANFPLLEDVDSIWSSNSVVTSLPTELFSQNPLIKTAQNFASNAANLQEIPSDLFAGTALVSIRQGFNGCSSLVEVPDDFLAGLPITDAQTVFRQCTSLKRVGHNFMKGVKITTAADMFRQCSALETIGDNFFADSDLNTNSTPFNTVTTIKEVGKGFCARTKLTVGISLSSHPLAVIGDGYYEDCALLTSTTGLFPSGAVLTSIGDNVLKGTAIGSGSALLSARSALKTVGKNFLRGTKISTAQNMFLNCTQLVSIGDGSLSDLPNLTSMATVFSGCRALVSIGNQVLSNNPAVNILTNALLNCNVLATIGDDFCRGSFFTTVDSFFASKASIQSVGNNVFADCPRLDSAKTLFNGCTGLVSVGDNLLANNPNLRDVTSLFTGCTKLTTVGNGVLANDPLLATITTLFTNCPVETIGDDFCRGSAVASFDSYFRAQTTIKSIGNNFFRGCPNLTSVYRGLREMAALVSVGDDCFAECPTLTNATALFYTNPVMTTIGNGLLRDCPALSTIDSLCYGTPVLAYIGDDFLRNDQNVTTTASIFGYATGGTRGIVSIGDNFMRNTGITSALSFFANQTLLLKYVGQNFMRDCVNLTNARSIFYSCGELESVGEGMLVGAPITNVYGTFYYCAKLKRIPSDFGADATGITEAAYFAQGCTVLENIPQDLLRGCTGLLTCNNMYMNVKGFKEAPRPDYFKDCPNITSARSAFNGVVFTGDAVFDTALMSKTNFPSKNVNLEYFYGSVDFNRTIDIAQLFNADSAFFETPTIGWSFYANKTINGAAIPQIQAWRAKVAPSAQPSSVFTNANNLSDYASLTNGWYTA